MKRSYLLFMFTLCLSFAVNAQHKIIVKDAQGQTLWEKPIWQVGELAFGYEKPDYEGIATPNADEAVNLGFKTLWAPFNWGASQAAERGGLIGWADITGQIFSIEDKYYPSVNPPFSIYNSESYDIVRCSWGDQWRLPKVKEIRMLIEQCRWEKEYDEDENFIGYRVYGIGEYEENSIFLPLTGKREGEVESDNTFAYYWTGNLNPILEEKPAVAFTFGAEDDVHLIDIARHYGLAIRPVYGKGEFDLDLKVASAENVTLHDADIKIHVTGDVDEIKEIGIIIGEDTIPCSTVQVDAEGNIFCHLQNLECETEYSCKAYAVLDEDDVRYGEESFTFSTAIPHVGGQFEIISSSMTEIKLKFTLEGDVNEYTDYRFTYQADGSSEEKEIQLPELPEQSPIEITMTDLTFLTKYWCRVYCNYKGTEKLVTYADYSTTADSRFPVADAIDLGLPSGTKWASWNMGASQPGSYEGYYTWGTPDGETPFGGIQGNDIAGSEWDIAHIQWHGDWHMPNSEEISELEQYCTVTLCPDYEGSGVRGNIYTGPSGNSIFIPLSGFYSNDIMRFKNQWTYMWSSNRSNGVPVAFVLGYDNMTVASTSKLIVRPVSSPKGNVWSTTECMSVGSDYAIMHVTLMGAYETATRMYVRYGTSLGELNQTSDFSLTAGNETIFTLNGLSSYTMYYLQVVVVNGGREFASTPITFRTSPQGVAHAIDLGLPSGILWADMNLGANSSEQYGKYYGWAETDHQSSTFYRTDYQWTDPADNMYCIELGEDIAGDERYDAARAEWKGSWMIPSRNMADELINSCTWTQTSQNGIEGWKVTGPNGNSIFLPAAGHKYEDTSLSGTDDGITTTYWTSSFYSLAPGTSHFKYKDAAYTMFMYNSGGNLNIGTVYEYRFMGRVIRPVCYSEQYLVRKLKESKKQQKEIKHLTIEENIR